jgi:hypothetical protein
MDYIIAVTDIPAELWRTRSRYESEESALAAKGARGDYIVEINSDGSAVALWRWDESTLRWKRPDFSNESL